MHKSSVECTIVSQKTFICKKGRKEVHSGEKEEDNSTVTVRRRFVKDQETTDLDSLISGLNSEINKRSLPYRESK